MSSRIDEPTIIRIVSCSDSMLWYSDRIGSTRIVFKIDTEGAWVSETWLECYKGYINVVRHGDFKIL